MNERISVTVALSVTVDPQCWYSRFRADPGIDIPDRMLCHLRTLPGIQDAGGNVELRRLIRRGSRHCRQSAQHRGVVDVRRFALNNWTLPRPGRASAGYLKRLCRRLCASTKAIHLLLPTIERRIPHEPSADFL